MTAILAAAALGAWSYSGFLAEVGPTVPPTPPPSAPAPRPPGPIVPPAPDVPEIDEERAPPHVPAPAPKNPEPARADASKIPPPAVAALQAPAARYRLADDSGQLWEHPDPEALRSFVRDRNRSWTAQVAASPYLYGFANCASGRCR